ncbi:MAG: quinone oxidoreductase family protein [Polyangiaceae bacterium]|jgi:NADPH:quinone reductase
MRVAEIEAYGGPEQIRIVERPTPEPGPAQVRVRVEAAGVNFVDVYNRTGLYKSELPLALGKEGAGTVEALGSGVTELRIGDRVAWVSVTGSYATHVIAHPVDLVKVPDEIDAVRAAAVMLQGLTAHYLVRSTWRLERGQRCLMHAAAGGVGLLFCQIASRLGAEVIGTASTDEKARLAREAGASHVIDYVRQDFEEEVKKLTRGDLVDVVYDSVGKTTFDKSLRCLRPRGMLVAFGQSSGVVPPFDLRILNDRGSLFVTRPSLRDYTRTHEELASRAAEVLGWVARGELSVRVHEVLPLDRAADAQRMLEARVTSGKVVLAP